ncbi:MAG: peptide ABC transporter substrate-binding protein, partial [Eubacteriales bacterium]|nr:peptide ABC transporter substrate-binding protein [Eubacteriales bacterium]
PPDFVNVNGLDYVNIGDLAPITAQGLAAFNAQKALEHRDLAKEELIAAGATLPVKILMSYNPAVTSWAEECQVVEQQLEELLGNDYIDIIVEAGPSSGFLSAVRRAGQYALLKCNWGPDYADPETYTDPFALGGTYNFIEFAEGYTDADGNKTYNNLVDAAKAITGDIMARYEAFAKAEAFIINHAFVIPFGYGSGGYIASRLNPFESQYAPFGLSSERYKGQALLEEPMNTDRYFDAYDQWLADREALSSGN